jgi:hypothetical protein
MHYELWDLESRNLLYDFESLGEALEAAHELTELNPDHYPEKMALGRMNDDESYTWLAKGDDLLAMREHRPAV